MEGRLSIGLFYLMLCLTSLVITCFSSSKDGLKMYIIYMGNIRDDESSSLLRYQNMLQKVTKSNSTPKCVLHHYKRSFSGFVAKLTDEEAQRMAGLDGVVSIFPNEKRQTLTTRSWDFIGFPAHVERAQSQSDIIIGVIDSGIWPESESFNDKGYSLPPKKWKGTCNAVDFACNNKIIGARSYRSDENFLNLKILSPRDTMGHGTHIASIAAGNPVNMANMLGFAKGTTRGGASSARIAVYKVCWSNDCLDMDILTAFDDAIADGVDIISISLGGGPITDPNSFGDVYSIGTFHAMKSGIVSVLVAGNYGPKHSSLTNFSPWAIVVAASTIDRKFVTKVKLGDNKTFEGTSINTFDLKGELYPIIYGGDAAKPGVKKVLSRNCSDKSLDDDVVKGKIILCEGGIAGAGEAHRAGAVGVLVQGHINVDTASSFPLPACFLESKDAASVHKYIRSTRTPLATILKTNEFKDNLAPAIASFSSRGPNKVVPEILKPDLIAPGVDIIASWSPNSPISTIPGEKRKLEFNIISGTSMACPHVSGAAAYIKSYNPTWSPAAIRSALMTTAKQISPDRDAEFAYGAGQIDPIKALSPGLIYEANEEDYISFLCGQGINASTILLIADKFFNCTEIASTTARDLNLPSFALKAPRPKHHLSGSFKQTVTNVGSSMSTYKAIVTAPKGLNISVSPSVLSFTSLGEKHTYILTIDGSMKNSIQSGSLVWDDGKYQVRSPIVIFDERAEKGNGVKLYCTSYIYIVILSLLFYY